MKCTNDTRFWIVYHKDTGNDKELQLNTTAAAATNTTMFNSTTPTDTEFTLGTDLSTNGSGKTYVAYLFAHDTASDGLIQCGSYTGNGSTDGPEINLGWQPQWILVKDATSSFAYSWLVFDTQRGLPVGGDSLFLQPNDSAAETTYGNYLDVSATGFKVVSGANGINRDTEEHIYMAIRSAAAPAITWPTNIEWAGGVTPSTPAEGETDVFTFTTDDGGTTYTGIQSIDNAS